MESKNIENRYEASQAQNLLKEYGPFLTRLVEEVKKEFEIPINADTAEKIGLEFTKQQSARQALNLLLKKIHSKADDRN